MADVRDIPIASLLGESAISCRVFSRRNLLLAAMWIVAIAAAMPLDRAVARFVADHRIDAFLNAHKTLRQSLKLSGEFVVLVAAAGVVWWRHPLRWRGAVFLIAGALVSGLNGLVKWMVGRTRPFKLFDADGNPYLAPFEFHPFRGGLKGLFVGKNLGFPSGHAALAFAAATGLALLCPRWRWWFFAAATVTAAERVLENAHYPSDVIAAMALGVGGVFLIRRAARRVMNPFMRKVLPSTKPGGSSVIER